MALKAALPPQAPEGHRAMQEGTVLCLQQSRAPLGRVEEVFGQVRQPLYSLRYAGGGQGLPDQATVGAAIASVQRLTEYILPEQLYAKGCTHTPAASCLPCCRPAGLDSRQGA